MQLNSSRWESGMLLVVLPPNLIGPTSPKRKQARVSFLTRAWSMTVPTVMLWGKRGVSGQWSVVSFQSSVRESVSVRVRESERVGERRQRAADVSLSWIRDR